jgi:hypothetical protein
MLRLPRRVCACACALTLVACGGSDSTGPKNAEPPAFLLQGWIWPIASNNARTYDFTQVEAAGVRSVEIRAWQYAGTLGWQSNQLFSFATYIADTRHIVISTATGYEENWQIVAHDATTMTLRDQATGTEVVWYNCAAQGWPPLIYASMQGCS